MINVSKPQRLVVAFISLIGWLAVGLQIYLSLTRTNLDHSVAYRLVQVLSFFTVTTNIIVALVATATLLAGRVETFLSRPGTSAAAAVYIFIVGVVYEVLLRATWKPSGLQLVADIGLHTIVPIAFVLYWLTLVSKGNLRYSQPAWWLLYPLVYVAWTLLRGAQLGLYPYPFADVSILGYRRALTNSALLLMAFYALGLFTVALDHLLARHVSRLRIEDVR